MSATSAWADLLPELDVSKFASARIIVLGEVHDNPQHHINQARIVQTVQPASLVFEMITPSDALNITSEIRLNAADLEEVLDWEGRGWPDFSTYYPIFTSAPDAAIFGGALPRDTVRQAVTDGAATVFGGGSALFGLDLPLPNDQLAQRIALQQEAHCNALPENILPGMVEAQRLRDASLAQAALAALQHAEIEGADRQIVVITGNGHARNDWGVPGLLRIYFEKADQDVEIVSLGQFETDAIDVPPFDHWLVTQAFERDDPCATFK